MRVLDVGVNLAFHILVYVGQQRHTLGVLGVTVVDDAAATVGLDGRVLVALGERLDDPFPNRSRDVAARKNAAQVGVELLRVVEDLSVGVRPQR